MIAAEYIAVRLRERGRIERAGFGANRLHLTQSGHLPYDRFLITLRDGDMLGLRYPPRSAGAAR